MCFSFWAVLDLLLGFVSSVFITVKLSEKYNSIFPCKIFAPCSSASRNISDHVTRLVCNFLALKISMKSVSHLATAEESLHSQDLGTKT